MDLKEVLKAVSDEYGVSESAILSKSRKREIIEPKAMAIYILRDHNTNVLAKFFNCDRTTIYYHIDVMSFQTLQDPQLIKRYDNLKLDLEMKTKIKLTIAQLKALKVVVNLVIKNYKAVNEAEALLQEIVQEIESKLDKSIESLELNRNKYRTLALSPVQARGLKIWYTQMAAFFSSENYLYERIQLNKLINQIDQQYA